MCGASAFFSYGSGGSENAMMDLLVEKGTSKIGAESPLGKGKPYLVAQVPAARTTPPAGSPFAMRIRPTLADCEACVSLNVLLPPSTTVHVSPTSSAPL